MKINLRQWCIKNKKEYIINEWDEEKNKEIFNLNMEDLTHGVARHVWWKCQECGNSWKAVVGSRTRKIGTGCPKCYNRSTSYPEQFLYVGLKEKFEDVLNRHIINGYEYDIFIKDLNLLIEYDGYYWHKKREDKSKRDKEKEDYAIDNNFNFLRILEVNKKINKLEHNSILTPRYYDQDLLLITFNLVIEYINNRFNFDISSNLHEDIFKLARENSRTELKERSILYTHPELMEEYDYKKNEKNGIKPSSITYGSNMGVYWRCREHNHSWKASVNSRAASKLGCPVCCGQKVQKGFNDLATTHPHLLEEWDYEKNKEIGITPNNITAGSNDIVSWICKKDGYRWDTAVSHRAVRDKPTGCPLCAGTLRKKVYSYNIKDYTFKLYDSISQAQKAIKQSSLSYHFKKGPFLKENYVLYTKPLNRKNLEQIVNKYKNSEEYLKRAI